MSRKIKFNYNQLSLPFLPAGRQVGELKASLLSYENCERIFWTLSLVSFLSIGTYIYAVNATAHNVAMRASLERESSELNTQLATLEFQYIALKSEVTLETAHQLGFQEVKEPVYVSRNGDAKSLSFNTINR